MTKSLLDFWKKSHWLTHAPEKFAEHVHPKEWQDASEIRGTKPSLQNIFEITQKNAESGKSFADSMKAAAVSESQRLKPMSELVEAARVEIIRQAKKGSFVGFGFDRPRLLDTSPVHIPKEIWSGKINWSKNTITFQSLELIDVRINMSGQIRSSTFDAPEMLPPKKTTSALIPASRGRPSVKTEVAQAFHALNAENLINTAFSSKSHYPLIREWLSNNANDLSVNPSSMSDETIRRITAPLFKALKENQ